MAVYRDKTTGRDVIVEQIVDDIQIARWLAFRNMIEPPLPFEPAPHLGEPGDWAVISISDRGVQSYEIVTDEQFVERYEPYPED